MNTLQAKASRMGALISFVAILLLSWGAQALEIRGQSVPLNHVSAEDCKDCHKQIYEQWKGSMHAQSTASGDPIHNAFYRNVVGDPHAEGVLDKKGNYPNCLLCHAPNAAIDKATKTDAMPAYKEGVNCTACHALSAFKGIRTEDGKFRLGMLAYERGDTLNGPSGFTSGGDANALPGMDETDNPHVAESKGLYMPLEGKPRMFRTADACMGCHDQRNNGNNVPLCQTGSEYAEGGSKVTCQTCHMSLTDGLADHSMGGGHNMGMLKRSMVLDVATETVGDQVKATVYLENLQPHTMPTGAPFRTLYIKVVALDAEGAEVWSNYKTNPSEEDPQAYLHLELHDDEGKPTLPPVAKKVGPDNRLKPFEKRELAYNIPAAGVAAVRAEAHYNLLWPNLQKAMEGKIPDPLRTPQAFMKVERKL
ncbi:multiheme c-type cytochrome [Magnetospira thiophila]